MMASLRKKTIEDLSAVIENLENNMKNLEEKYEQRLKNIESILENVLDTKIIQLEEREEESEKRIAEIKKQLMEVHEGNTNRHTEIKCKECVKICDNTKNLRQHMKDTHTKNFPCEFCSKSFHVSVS